MTELSVFSQANEHKIPWGERSKLIQKHYPHTAKLDWFQVFYEDPAVLGRIINDIIKLDGERTGKPGKRPTLELDIAEDKLRKLRGEDYTLLEFKDAFKVLCGKLSIRGVAHKTGLDKSYIHRLLNGDAIPTVEAMETIAKAFKKKPSYFVEYRIGYIVAVISHKLEQIPETSVHLYLKLAGRNERS
jgi:transcriptional regulator with XRE-family HTH domain